MSTVREPTGSPTLTVEVRRRSQVLELAVRGTLDGAAGRALLNDLVAVHDHDVRHVVIDLGVVHEVHRDGYLALDRCRAFATARGATFDLTGQRRSLRTIDLRSASPSS